MRSVQMHSSLLIGWKLVILAYRLIDGDPVSYLDRVYSRRCSAAVSFSKNINSLDMVISSG